MGKPHVSAPGLQSREFTMGMGFSMSGEASRMSMHTIYLNMTDEKANCYFALRQVEIDEWWNSLSREERNASGSIYKEKERELFDRIDIETTKSYRMTLFQTGFVGRWFNLYIESKDKENWELVMVLNNIDWRIPLGIDIEKDTPYNLWVNFDFPSRSVDFWLNDSHFLIDISHVPEQTFCPSGGADNFAMQLMPGGLSPNSEVDYFFIANGNRSYSEIQALYNQYYEE